MKTKTRIIRGAGLVLLALTAMACSLLSSATPTPLAPVTTIVTPSPTPPHQDAERALPDLIAHIRVSMGAYSGGCVQTYVNLTSEVCVENRGEGDAGTFDIQAGNKGAWSVQELGSRDTHCIQVADDLSGIDVVVDSQNAVNEADEENNIWRVPVPTPPVLCTPIPDVPTETPTRVPDPPTPTPVPQPDPPTPTSVPPTSAALAITSFAIEVTDVQDGGKRITFRWQTTGATYVQLVSGTRRRFALWWSNLAPNGSFEHTFYHTNYVNPPMTLTAYDAEGRYVNEIRYVAWPCDHTYFFANPPDLCPFLPASFSAAAEQRFERGWMVWMREIQLESYVADGVIFVFYDNGMYERFDDTWAEGQPASDPSIVAPPGLQQPVRGFGKLWRENSKVREGLGWAVESEVAYSGAWQPRTSESIPSVAFLLLRDGSIVRTYNWDAGSWDVYSQP